jgi:predicted ferric reductase
VYGRHHWIGGIALSLLLFHPLLLVLKYLSVSFRDAALFFLPAANNLPNGFGLVALASLITLLVITFYSRLPYHQWKLTHWFMRVAFVFAVLHLLVIQSDVSRFMPLKWYMLLLAAIGLTSAAYRSVVSWTAWGNCKYEMKEVRALSSDITEIVLSPVGKALAYRPGQFSFIRFVQKGFTAESHPFTLSSSPDEPELRFSIKASGDDTKTLMQLKSGTYAYLEGPFGEFIFDRAELKRQIWVAGGIGITPFLSMARSLPRSAGLSRYGGYDINMFYCVKNSDEAVFLKELEQIAERFSRFRVMPWYSDVSGFITAQAIEKRSGLRDADIFICGPGKMIRSLRTQMIGLGVLKKRMYSEEFDLL